jgi:hypothetical protein
MNQHGADLEEAAKMADHAGRAAKMADNPMVKNAMQQPAMKRMVESSAQRVFQEAMKQSASKASRYALTNS